MEGDTLELVCTFFGRPRPVVEWSGPKKLPPPVENFVFLSDGYQVTSTLKVLNANHSYKGEYSCEGDVPDYPAPSKTQNFFAVFQSEFPVGRHCASVVAETVEDDGHLLWYIVQVVSRETKSSWQWLVLETKNMNCMMQCLQFYLA